MEGGADEERELSCRHQPQERPKRPQRGAQYGPMGLQEGPEWAPRGARGGSKRGPKGLRITKNALRVMRCAPASKAAVIRSLSGPSWSSLEALSKPSKDPKRAPVQERIP